MIKFKVKEGKDFYKNNNNNNNNSIEVIIIFISYTKRENIISCTSCCSSYTAA